MKASSIIIMIVMMIIINRFLTMHKQTQPPKLDPVTLYICFKTFPAIFKVFQLQYTNANKNPKIPNVLFSDRKITNLDSKGSSDCSSPSISPCYDRRIIPGLVVNNHGDHFCPLSILGPLPNGRYSWLINGSS